MDVKIIITCINLVAIATDSTSRANFALIDDGVIGAITVINEDSKTFIITLYQTFIYLYSIISPFIAIVIVKDVVVNLVSNAIAIIVVFVAIVEVRESFIEPLITVLLN